MKKLSLGILVLLVACALPAMAQQTYFTSVMNSGNVGTQVFCRVYSPTGANPVNPAGAGNCPTGGLLTVGWEEATRSCQLNYSTQRSGYRCPVEDVFQDGAGGGLNTVHYGVVDYEANQGAANHAGYYFWAARNVNTGDPTSTWYTANCTGATVSTCLAQGNTDSSTGFAIASTPLGTLNPVGGFRPIPVPLVSGSNASSGDIFLNWRAAEAAGTAQTGATYQVFGVAKNSCAPPLASEFPTTPLETVSGLTFTANTLTHFGFAPTVPKCYYFALKVKFPGSTNSISTRFLSANSQGVVFGGLATEVYDLMAKNFKNGVNVTWKTSLEEGTQKFNILRAYSQTGPFSKIGEVNANGQPSSYSYLDTTVPPASRRTAWYQLEAVDVDNNASKFGPVLASK